MEFLATVAIFFYNHEKYVRQTLSSVLKQQSKYGFKILAVDDNSTDETQQIIRDVCTEYDTNRVTFLFNPINKGLNDTFENVLKQVDTKYFIMLGGDDYWIDERKIEKGIQVLEDHPNVSYVHTGFQKLEECTNTFDTKYNSWKWKMPNERNKRVLSQFNDKWSFYPLASTSCMRTEVLKKGYVHYKNLLHSYVVGEGTFVNVSMCMLGGDYFFIPDITTIYRVRQNSLSRYSENKKLFLYKSNYVKLKIEVLKMLGLKPNNFFLFSWYNYSVLLCLAYNKNTLDEFDYFIKEIEVEIPSTLKKYFYICAKKEFMVKVNYLLLKLYNLLKM